MTMMIKCLAGECKDVAFMAIKPGIVDTEMVSNLLAESSKLDTSNADFMKKTPKLDPKVPAEAIARLVLEAPASYSGHFFAFNSPPK